MSWWAFPPSSTSGLSPSQQLSPPHPSSQVIYPNHSDLGLPAGVFSPLTGDGFPPHTPPHSSSQRPSLTLALFCFNLIWLYPPQFKAQTAYQGLQDPTMQSHACCLLYTDDTHTHSHPGSGSRYPSNLQMTEVSANPWVRVS